MKNKTLSVIRMIVKKKISPVALGVCKLLVFVLLLSAGSIKAQCPPQSVVPYPAVGLGQQLLINPNSPLWTPMMDQAATTRAMAQDFIDNNPCADPVDQKSCIGVVCCRTSRIMNGFGGYNWVTVCWNDITDEILCTKVQ